MILSCSTITWEQLKSTAEFEDALSTIKRVGYSDVAIEYSQVPPSLRAKPELGAALAKKHGLSVSSVAMDTSPQMGRITRAFGANLGWLCIFERDFEAALEKTKKLAADWAKLGVEISLHPHVKSNIETTDQIDRLMKACEPNRTSVCFDTAHLTALGIDLDKFVGKYASKISLVHLKDLKELKPIKEIDYSKDFVDLGDGIADLRGAMKSLRRVKYNGPIIVEVDYPQTGTVEVSVEKNYTILTSIM